MLRHRDIMLKSSLGYNSKFQASLKHRVRPYPKTKGKNKKNKGNTPPKEFISREIQTKTTLKPCL